MKHLRKFETETAFETEKPNLDEPWVTLTEEDEKAHFMPTPSVVASWVGGGEADATLDKTEAYSSPSPMKTAKKLTAIKFPAEATELVSLDSTNLETVDLSSVPFGSPIVEQVKESVGDDVKVIEPINPILDEFVDLGLPSGTLWCKHNLGANSQWEYGDYYQWGALNPSTNGYCEWRTAPFNNGSKTFDSEYFKSVADTVCPNKTLSTDYDVVYKSTNGQACMPSSNDVYELCSNTTVKLLTHPTTKVKAAQLTSKKDSSKYILIPLSGILNENGNRLKGYYGNLWTTRKEDYSETALTLCVSDIEAYTQNEFPMYTGCTLRPVIHKK